MISQTFCGISMRCTLTTWKIILNEDEKVGMLHDKITE